MTFADYSTGNDYEYTYDAVGNRKSQDTMVNGLPYTVNYLYDDANRLASVNGVPYTWNANGNLLSDGTNTYGYDFANRMVSFNGTSSYAYNGLGDRLRQTVNGNTTNYTLDLNTGLTQVLNDGTNSYLYGNGRIAQTQGTVTEYFLGDALGSVRQLTDASGEITLAKSYAPYGELANSAGSAVSPFAFTGEQQDASGLTYLRARYYTSGDGRFISRDTWMGDYNRPLSLNRWMYTEGNPVNYTDPSGHWIRPECQWMPTKGLYEYCILLKYGLEPISVFELGQRVEGERGCYSGPDAYRAPGYIEGIEGHFGGIPSFTTGLEVVYDFANMQRASFTFRGVIINDGLVGAGSSVYFGKALGLKSNTDVIQDYRDVSFSATVGLSFDIGIGGAVGRGGFVAASSNTIPMLRGKTWYIGVSVSGDLVEGIDLSGSWVTYTPTSSTYISYLRADNTVDSSRLYSDILNGAGSPWGPLQLDLGNPSIFIAKSAVRAYGLFLAQRYVRAYEILHNENPN